MYSTDNFYNPIYTDDASYGDPITGMEDHEEDLHHEDNTDGHQHGHPTETQDVPITTDNQTTNNQEYDKEVPPETQDAPTPINTKKTNDQGNVQ